MDEVVLVEFCCSSSIAALNTSIAGNWPHVTSEGTMGPVQFGEYQSEFGNRALVRRELYCKRIS